MGETCAVCKKGQGPEKCEVCGFSDNGFINRQFPIPEDAKNWIETVVKPYRAQWEKTEAARHGTFTDPRDGKTYKTIKIGGQIWMAENLNYKTKEQSVFGIPLCKESNCYNNDPKNAVKYGRLYDWQTAKWACPSGWRLPSKEEWDVLIDFVGGEEIAGKKLKSKWDWNEDGNGTDDFGFAAMPGGIGGGDGFSSRGDFGYWWTNSTSENDDSHVYGEYINFKDDNVYHYDYDKSYLFSVRCIKD